MFFFFQPLATGGLKSLSGFESFRKRCESRGSSLERPAGGQSAGLLRLCSFWVFFPVLGDVCEGTIVGSPFKSIHQRSNLPWAEAFYFHSRPSHLAALLSGN